MGDKWKQLAYQTSNHLSKLNTPPPLPPPRGGGSEMKVGIQHSCPLEYQQLLFNPLYTLIPQQIPASIP